MAEGRSSVFTNVAPSLTERAAHGIKWTATSTVVSSTLLFVQVAVLAHVLTKADFGLMTMMLVVLTFGQVYADMGLSSALIWRQESTKNTLSSLYWVNLLAGLGVFLAIVLLTPAIAFYFGQPQLARYLPWAASVFIVVPFGQQFQVLLQKELRFRILAINEMSASALGVTVAILCALGGAGVFALIAGQLVSASARTVVLALIGWRTWRPGMRLRLSDLRGYVRFGLNQMGERNVTLLTDNLDYLMIGRYLGSAALGVYSVAFQLAIMPYRRMNPVLMRVAFPVFSLRQGDDRAFRDGYFRVSVTLIFVVVPMLIGLLVVAPVAVPVLFGPKWVGAVPIVQVLAVLSILSTLNNPAGSLLLAKGRADLGFRMNLLRFVVALIAFFLVVRYGALAIAWAWVGVEAMSFVLWQTVIMRLMHSTVGKYLRALLRPLLLSALTGLCLEAVYLILRGAVESDVVLLVVLVFAGAGMHVGVWLVLERAFVTDTYAAFRGARELVK